ncbi:MAG: hypothetical protein LBC99_04015 [Spirochaetota bacterium]|jgi:tetratricopeptide (TPR) repeat protein|nr:hypothetical protein [Spirochaetota bacterium]
MKIAVHLVLVFSFLILLGACNIFDAFYPDDGSNNFERALANAEAAMKRDDFHAAIELYKKALDLKPTSSVAMIGIASATIMDEVHLMDIPLLMNSVFNMDISDATNNFLEGLAGARPGETAVQYRDRVIKALGKAAYLRAPVNSIIPETGAMTIMEDGSGLPVVDPSKSDGVIAATNCNSILNYIICKTIEAAFMAQDQFVVAKNLKASIDTAALATYNFPNINEIDPLTYDESIYEAQFIDFHAGFIKKYADLHEAFDVLRDLFLGRSTNTSLLNLVDVANGLLAIITNPASGMNETTVTTAQDSVKRINTGLQTLQSSFNDADSQIMQGFELLQAFQEEVEEFGARVIVDPDTGITLKHSWYPYTLEP